MPLVPAKCTQCGSNLTVEPSQDATLCPFCNTPFITEKAINNYNTTNVTNIENLHADIVNLCAKSDEEFVIHGGVLSAYQGKSLNVIIPNGVVAISRNVFGAYIESIEVPEGCREIYLNGCTNLQSLILPKTINKLTIIGAEKLASLELPHNLEELELNYLHSLRKLILPPNLKTAKINNSGIEKIDLNNGVIKLDCSYCTKIKEVTIPYSLGETSDFKFADCKSLEKVVLPQNIKIIKHETFERCEALKAINLPQGLLKIEGDDSDGYYVELGAFYGCSSLKSITIPSTVTSIGYRAFAECRNLIDVKVDLEHIHKSWQGVSGFETTPFSEKIGKTISWKKASRCQYCGGEFKGIIKKICKNCKKEKDY